MCRFASIAAIIWLSQGGQVAAVCLWRRGRRGEPLSAGGAAALMTLEAQLREEKTRINRAGCVQYAVYGDWLEKSQFVQLPSSRWWNDPVCHLTVSFSKSTDCGRKASGELRVSSTSCSQVPTNCPEEPRQCCHVYLIQYICNLWCLIWYCATADTVPCVRSL